MSGTVWGLGVGPGDPELLTLKAVRLLRAAPVIAYPAPEEGDSFARAIVSPHLPGGQEEIAIRMPIGDGQFPKGNIYDRAAVRIADHAAAGRDVAVLCEGDPFFYGSFMYLYARLIARCPVRVVPGVSSLMACADASGAPLAARNDTLTVIPAPLPEDELRARLVASEAAAVIKVGRHLGKLRRILDALGMVERARYIERATLDRQRILPLAEVTGEGAPYFSMVLVHSRGDAWR
ncbi:precorrin-2 C(20)-methyltransferase [Rhodospirillaceae bacterium SYSU D60014]|uniref:precorrin-2 C(20)-methyltransferase n=1 Tax=Virgifigura deserti TaxID=2268457 RepID=UPI000E66A735